MGRAIEGEDIHAPAHQDVEVAQVTRRSALNAVINPARGKAMMELLAEAPIRGVPVVPLLPRVWALQRNLTSYHKLPSATVMASPLTPLDSSDARKPMVCATSSGVTTRPGG